MPINDNYDRTGPGRDHDAVIAYGVRLDQLEKHITALEDDVKRLNGDRAKLYGFSVAASAFAGWLMKVFWPGK